MALLPVEPSSYQHSSLPAHFERWFESAEWAGRPSVDRLDEMIYEDEGEGPGAQAVEVCQQPGHA